MESSKPQEKHLVEHNFTKHNPHVPCEHQPFGKPVQVPRFLTHQNSSSSLSEVKVYDAMKHLGKSWLGPLLSGSEIPVDQILSSFHHAEKSCLLSCPHLSDSPPAL